MSMFENKTKPELERGNYLVYTDEPDTVIDSAGGGGGGGGGVAFFVANYDVDREKYVPEFTFNQVKEAFLAGKAVFVTSINEEDSYFEGQLLLVTQIAYNNSESQTVTLSNSYGFSSSDPDAIME